MSLQAQSEGFYEGRGLRQAKPLPEIHRSPKEIHISLGEIHESRREICISFADSYISLKEICISSRETYISFSLPSQEASVL